MLTSKEFYVNIQIRVGNTNVIGSSEDEELCQNQLCYMLGNDDTVSIMASLVD